MAKDDTSAETVGQVLRDARERAGLTQEQVAGDGGVDRSYLSDVERGTTSLSVDRLLRIARGLRLSAADLVQQIERALPAAVAARNPPSPAAGARKDKSRNSPPARKR